MSGLNNGSKLHNDNCFATGKEKGRRVKLVEWHTQVRAKKWTKLGEPRSSGILEFVDPMSKQRLDEYSRFLLENHVEKEENAKIDENRNKSLPDDFDVWKGVATSNKGLVLGSKSTKDPSFVLTGVLGFGSTYGKHT
nr:hypothetical protein [Tanacetum cinerariifolium]